MNRPRLYTTLQLKQEQMNYQLKQQKKYSQLKQRISNLSNNRKANSNWSNNKKFQLKQQEVK